MLVVPRRHVARLEELSNQEWTELFALVRSVCGDVAAASGVGGYNVGVNNGAAAGQTVEHVHVHVIPRRDGDVPDPRGGIRHLIPSRADYWSESGGWRAGAWGEAALPA
jgi:diadenosine tetraphosphate (Ap4A) HIT family hydrolase